MNTRTTLYAFFIRTGSMFSEVISTTSTEDWISKVREEARLPEATVVLIEPTDWDAPKVAAANADILRDAWPITKKNAQKALLERGLTQIVIEEITQRPVAILASPLTGLVVVIFAYTTWSNNTPIQAEPAADQKLQKLIQANLDRAAIFLEMDKIDNALEDLKSAYQLSSVLSAEPYARALLKSGQEKEKLGNLEGAIQEYEAAFKVAPEGLIKAEIQQIIWKAKNPPTIIHSTCPECIKEVQPEWKSCPYCGAILAQSTSQIKKPQEYIAPKEVSLRKQQYNIKVSRWVWFGGGLVVILVVLIVGYILAQSLVVRTIPAPLVQTNTPYFQFTKVPILSKTSSVLTQITPVIHATTLVPTVSRIEPNAANMNLVPGDLGSDFQLATDQGKEIFPDSIDGNARFFRDYKSYYLGSNVIIYSSTVTDRLADLFSKIERNASNNLPSVNLVYDPMISIDIGDRGGYRPFNQVNSTWKGCDLIFVKRAILAYIFVWSPANIIPCDIVQEKARLVENYIDSPRDTSKIIAMLPTPTTLKTLNVPTLASNQQFSEFRNSSGAFSVVLPKDGCSEFNNMVSCSSGDNFLGGYIFTITYGDAEPGFILNQTTSDQIVKTSLEALKPIGMLVSYSNLKLISVNRNLYSYSFNFNHIKGGNGNGYIAYTMKNGKVFVIAFFTFNREKYQSVWDSLYTTFTPFPQ